MKKTAMIMIAFLLSVLLPHTAVQAAMQKNIILNAGKGKAEIHIQLPDTAVGISTLRLRVKIEGDTDKIDPENPLNFELDPEIQSTFLETRYHAANQTYTIYLSDTSKLTDKTEFRLGTIVPNSVDDSQYSLGITVSEDGLEYVDGTGQLNQEKLDAPVSTGILINQPAENGEDAEGVEKEDEVGNQESKVQTGVFGNAAKTGDKSRIVWYAILLGISLTGAGFSLILRKRR